MPRNPKPNSLLWGPYLRSPHSRSRSHTPSLHLTTLTTHSLLNSFVCYTPSIPVTTLTLTKILHNYRTSLNISPHYLTIRRFVPLPLSSYGPHPHVDTHSSCPKTQQHYHHLHNLYSLLFIAIIIRNSSP